MGKLGFIGLGSQGAPMARRMIEAGYEVVLWGRRPESLEPFADTAASYAGSVAELAAQVDFCGVCVVDDAGVREICEQLIPAMPAGGCIAIHSTVNPALCRTLAEQAGARGIALLDAPVSGGGPGAAAGTLTVMVGGEADALAAVRPVFETYAGFIAHLGGVGAGQTAKLVNNNLMAANMALAWHALQAAQSLGIERSAFIELVRVSSGRSFSFDVCARLSHPADFQHGAPLLAKDVRLLGETVGETLGESRDFDALRDASAAFLALATAQ